MNRQPSENTPAKAVKQEPNQEPENNQDNLFAIVGIGASAGGLEAFLQILHHLPSDTGMAFVLIQHLAPDQESLLSEILARATKMPVSEARSGLAVIPNNVYVIPPNVKMTIAAGGVLKLTPRDRERRVFMSVDAFFISLAAERGNKAIGVILSGGDSDGARGVAEIKAAGGITFAQCQDTAGVSSMPNTAVATGQVDFILPPQAIGAELAKISRHPYVSQPKSTEIIAKQPQSQDPLVTIFTLLQAATGVDFSDYKQTTLRRRIGRRMALYKLEQLEQYTWYLQENATEVNALYHDLLINVTSFFRDPEVFDALKRRVFPTIVKDKAPGSPIRVWIAGCSTGEEAYSIAICLIEFLAEQAVKPPLQIYATDVSEIVIEKARSGIYTSSQLADVSSERLHRFFVQVEGGYQICKAVREQCVFARQNLINDPPFSRLDLISCRNVLIYLGTKLQKKLMPIFHYGLKPRGFLLLGTSETVSDTNLFALVDKKHKIYTWKLAGAQLSVDLVANNHPVLATQSEVQSDVPIEIEIQSLADRIVLNQYAPVGVIINSELEIIEFRGQTSPYLEPAPGKASLNLLIMAKAELRLELRTAIQQAKKSDLAIAKSGIELKQGDRVRQISVNVVPIKPSHGQESYYLVLFEDMRTLAPTVTAAAASNSLQQEMATTQSQSQDITRLRQELATTKEYLQSIIEEQQATNQDLRAANEEILSSNEELQSTNEELETAKEEIQAANEELNTINDELNRRNIEANHVSNDLQNLLSSTNIPILMLGGDLCIRRFTPLAQKILNLIPTDVGRPLGDINHNLNLPDLEQQIIDVINTLSVKQQEVQDREGHWYDLRIRPYRTIDNKIDGAVVMLVDIDALKRSAQQLQAARDYAEAIVETMREPLLVLDSNLRVLTANKSFYNAFEVSSAETLNHSIFELGNGQWNMPDLRSLLEEVLPQNNQVEDFEVEHVFEHIGHKTMLLSACKICRPDNDQLILLAIQDISQRKLLEEQRHQMLVQEQTARTAAESANRAKDEFLSVVSHELRSPLNSVIGWTQLLLNRSLDAAQTAQALESVERAAKLQVKLIEDLLDISQITTVSSFQLNTSAIALLPVIEAAIALVRPSAEAKHLQLEAVLEPQPLTVAGDAHRLQQVVGNLLSNAIKFTEPGGRITVKLERVQTLAQIQVSDTGQGISAEFLPHVFERFRQADSSKSRLHDGLGLGLAIVHHLVERHGGTVTAASPGEGQGATFLVQLPLLQSSQVESTAEILPPQPLVAASLEGSRILVVDDDDGMLELLRIILEAYRVQVTAVTSAAEAIAALTANPGQYDLLLSDIGMPHTDGYALIRQVRALGAQLGGMPAVALTAYVRQQEQSESLAAGFQGYITKPVEPAQLVYVIAELIGSTRVRTDSGQDG